MKQMFLLVFLLGFSVSAADYKAAVVLIPGTLSSVSPNDYFSNTIIQTLEAQKFLVKVITDLDPAGQFESNGSQTLVQLRDWYRKISPQGDLPLILVGHSAGGFYALHAAHLDKELPVKSIFFFSTPLNGSLLADNVLPEDLEFADRTGLFDFRGLPQLQTANVEKFLAQIRLNSKIKLFAFGGSQPFARRFDNRLNSKYLSVALSITGGIIGMDSDGIVEVDSAYSQKVKIISDKEKQMRIQLLPQLHARLEHPEQVFDYRFFLLGGTMNTRSIEEEQKRVTTEIARTIDSSVLR